MKFYVGQYLEFETAVAKITKISHGAVTMRRMSIGKEYDYMHTVSLFYLKACYKTGKVKAVDYLNILTLLSRDFDKYGGFL